VSWSRHRAGKMVGLKRLELLRPLERQNLNLVRLPIPPQPQQSEFITQPSGQAQWPLV
jgi:hypothetical protein